MDVLWYRRARADRDAEPGSFASWEFSTGAESFDDVGAPAKLAQRLASAAHQRIPERHAGLANDMVHWATGLGWGVFAAGLTALTPIRPAVVGAVTGVTSFAASYVLLAPLGVYAPIWEYDAPTLWKDFSAHALFGVVSGTALAVVDSVSDRAQR